MDLLHRQRYLPCSRYPAWRASGVSAEFVFQLLETLMHLLEIQSLSLALSAFSVDVIRIFSARSSWFTNDGLKLSMNCMRARQMRVKNGTSFQVRYAGERYVQHVFY